MTSIPPVPPTGGAAGSARAGDAAHAAQGAYQAGQAGYNGFKIAYNGINNAVNKAKKGLVNWLAIIDALVELYKKEQAVNQAQNQYQSQWTDDPNGKTNTANAKAVLEALEALKKFLKGGYKKFGKGLDSSVLGKIKELVDQAVYGTGTTGGGFSIIKLLEGLKGGSSYQAALKKWLASPASPQDAAAFFKEFNTALYNTAATDSKNQFFSGGWQNLISQCSDFNTIAKDQAQKESGTIEALESGMAKLIKKSYDLILAMVKLISG